MSAKMGFARYQLEDTNTDMKPLFDTIIRYFKPSIGDEEVPFKMLVSTIDYNEFVGRIGIGKIDQGTVNAGSDYLLVNHHDNNKKQNVRIQKLYEFDGLNRDETKSAKYGSIVAISGIEDLHNGDTITDAADPTLIEFQKISEPTISMYFTVNNYPLDGTEGKFLTSRYIIERLYRELNTDVSLRVENTDTQDCFKIRVSYIYQYL